ncbi:MAG TPA: hypothetical protein VNA22_07380 [Pyrinomonadaceae bacterium]|nr:hypothetical protein [Pyrinomonadaceae bacterium]
MSKRFTLAFFFALLLLPALASGQLRRGQRYTDWEPIVHLPPPINSEFDDHAAIITKDEKTMYFTSNRTGSVGGSEDIWVSTRKTKNSPWREPFNLGPTINTDRMERVRSFSADGRVLLFQSDRVGGLGLTDIWAVYRQHVNDDFAWSEPVNLGAMINTPSPELAANYLFADAGRVKKLFFSSSKPGGFGGPDIYESTINDLGFEISENIFELNSPSIETCFWVRDDGLELIFSSNRPNLAGDIQQHDMWVAYRESVYDRWSPPRRLGPNINVPNWQDVNPALSFDNRTMLMASRRPGGIGAGTFDIYVTTRRPIGKSE